jgi:hypothetical protein
MIRYAVAAAMCLGAWTTADAHDIYTGLHGKNGQLCCGGDDCSATVYRERRGGFEFLTREGTWISIPIERITFLPIPGEDLGDGDSHRAHLCYRKATDVDQMGIGAANVFDGIFLYCAFIPPGGT